MSFYSKTLNWRPSHDRSNSVNITQPTLLNHLRMMWESWKRSLSTSDEPRIWQTCDRRGNTMWHAYDPVTGRSLSCASEAEVRIWLENRYSYPAVS